METNKEQITLEEHVLQQFPELGNWLTSENELWSGFSSIFALLLFIIWTVRFELDFAQWVFIVDLYAMGILVALRKSNYHSNVEKNSDYQYITFTRSGIAWKRINDSLVGLAIISSIFTYMFSNALPNNPEFVSIINIVVITIHVITNPIIPTLSKIKFLPILKSKIHISFDGDSIKDVSLSIHPLGIQITDEILSQK